ASPPAGDAWPRGAVSHDRPRRGHLEKEASLAAGRDTNPYPPPRPDAASSPRPVLSLGAAAKRRRGGATKSRAMRSASAGARCAIPDALHVVDHIKLPMSRYGDQ